MSLLRLRSFSSNCQYCWRSTSFLKLGTDHSVFRSEGFNSRIGGHYWADDSRDLIAVIQALRDFNTAIQPQGWELQTKPGTFLNQLFDYLSFLSESGGSEIPPDIPRMNDFLLAKTAIFSLKEKEVDNQLFPDLVDIIQLGKGSYAKVWSGVDEKTGVRIAFKRANDGLSDEDMTRFRHEFDIMHRLDSPYIVKAYSYDPFRHQYTMEYVPQTLSDFMRKNDNKLSPRRRKDLAPQFLRGMRYIHSSSLLHRDLSLYQRSHSRIYGWISIIENQRFRFD